MQLTRCPVCHARISLEAMVQDEAGRELLGLLAALNNDFGMALIGYLGLFRSAARDLSNEKALRLTKEIISMGLNSQLPQAMRQTVEQIQSKGGKPLTNHNYLKRVLEDVPVVSVPAGQGLSPETLPLIPAYKSGKSKTSQALQNLEDFGNGR